MNDELTLDLFGEYDENGKLVKDADTCILSGRLIEPGDSTFAIGRYFYRVKAEAMSRHTEEVRAELEKLVKQQDKKAAPPKGGKSASETPSTP